MKHTKVFIIMGQSNTLEMGVVMGEKDGTLERAVKQENLYGFLTDAEGKWTDRQDVRNVSVMVVKGVYRNDWLTISGNKIGIEIGIGHHLGWRRRCIHNDLEKLYWQPWTRLGPTTSGERDL